MEALIFDKDTECLPLPELVRLSESNFRERKVMERAARSVLYREKWAAAGVVPEAVQTYADLKLLPYTSGGELRQAQAQNHPDEVVCSDHVQLWISTSGTTGSPKWIPVSLGNLSLLTEVTPRVEAQMLGVTQGFSALSVTAPAPFITDSSAYNSLMSHILNDLHAEFIFVALPEALDALNFARAAQTKGLFAFPSLALVIAEGVTQQAAEGAKAQFRKERSWRNLLGVLATKVMRIKAKHVFSFKWGLFAGEPVEPYRRAIVEAYGLQPVAGYSATEFGTAGAAECLAHDGMHLLLDLCLPEVIPQTELEREGTDAAYVPQAVPLWEASPGLTGELVLTSFAEALPLIRYRTSDLVEVVSTEPCACGRTHPRIKVLHRSDDIVNLGLVRFSTYLLKEKLGEVGAHGHIGKWQLRVTRKDYKPKVILLAEPLGEVEPDLLVEEIAGKLDELEGVRQAWENGLIARPEVRLVKELVEERTATGKLKLAIYEDAYSAET